MSFSRYLSKLGQLLNSSGQVTAAGHADGSVTPVKLSSDAQFMGFKNRIINGAMMIDQRNAGASLASKGYCVDRWATDGTVSSWNISQQQVADAPEGFVNSLKITNTASGTASSTQFAFSRQIIEGFNIADLGWGTASAKAVTVSLWVKSSIAGTYSLYAINHSENRSYVATFTINATNTWEYKTVTIPGDTSGNWLTNNSNGIRLGIDLGSGSNYQGTANAWNSGWVQRSSSTVSFCQTNGATFQLTGVQLEKGSTATSFDYRPYGTELMLCQRYYQQFEVNSYVGLARVTSGGANIDQYGVPLKCTMRAAPSISAALTANDGAGTATATPNAIFGTANGPGINFNLSGGLGGYRPASLYVATGQSFTISAEL